MEEPADGKCSVVYFCACASGNIYELHHKSSLEATANARSEDAALDSVYDNVRILLDEDQGGFHEVFVNSNADECLVRLETYANVGPTVVLVELHDDSSDGSPVLLESPRTSPFQFLRALSADVQGARYQKHVMPFALLAPDAPGSGSTLDAAFTTACLSAGALDIVHSPIGYEDINRLVGHVKDAMRPSARLLGSAMAQGLVDSIRSTTPAQVARHQPDQTIPSHRKQTVEDAIRNWHFPAHDFAMDELTYAALCMLEHMLRSPVLEGYRLPRAELMTFLLATRRQYKHEREVQYHNWRHAVDVMQSLYCFLLDVRLCSPVPADERERKELNSVERLLTPLDGLILLVSAIGHDVGHPGVNNAFLVACNHPLAQIYNDKSVLENYHCAAYSQLLRRHWPALTAIPSFRSTMISTILATDMQRHFEYMTNMGELKRKVENSEPDLGDWSDKDRESTRELMMALLMKAADISNVARPFDVSAIWARILMNEFSRQGQLEAELQIPTCLFGGPPNKEDLLAAAQSQKGFMSLFGFPLFSGMTSVMPSVSCAIRELENNQQIWERRIEYEKRRRVSDGESAPLIFSSVTKKEVEEAKLRHHKSEPAVVPETAAQAPSSPTKRKLITDSALSSVNHAAHQRRQHTTYGVATSDDERSSAPYLPATAFPQSPLGGCSRRSSKDVALDQLQLLNPGAHPNLNSDSRRGSVDGGWQIRQGYSGSRRGSKDESLTTILVTSQGSPARRSSPSSSAQSPRLQGSPGKHSVTRHSMSNSQKQAAARYSVPSSRSHTTSSATAGTVEHSPSTQPSSLAPTDDEPTPPAEYHPSVAATEDPFITPGNWPNHLDGTHRESAPEALPSTPLPPSENHTKPESPRIIACMANGEEEDVGRSTPRKSERGVRESRSRSRLRGLKFWKKRRDVSGVEGGDSSSP